MAVPKFDIVIANIETLNDNVETMLSQSIELLLPHDLLRHRPNNGVKVLNGQVASL